ncbi:MAG: hypothetical protein IJ561_07475 [Ruminococcus sp.]|nr:hypothetical protein [Ruminococcus sp.]
MKLFKRVSAVVASAAMAATMAITASAATYEDAVQAAKDAGVQAHNVQQLSNFLEPNKDKFTSDQYDKMIEAVKSVSDTYIAPKATELFSKKPAELTEDEKVQIGKSFSEDDKAAIIKALVDLGASVGVEVTAEVSNSNIGFDVSAKFNGVETPVDDPVAQTGDAADFNTTIAFVAACAVLLAGTGLVVVAKKNKEN